MLKATVGTWLNYATTVIFQVLFAARFGSGAAASAYVLSFTIAVAIGAIFIFTTQSIYIPRLISRDGHVLSKGIRQIIVLTFFALVLFLVFAAVASPLVSTIAAKLNAPGAHLPAVMRWAAVFGFSQVVVGQLAAVAWARGLRFIPAVTPAIPSLVASVPLALGHHVSAQTLYLLLTVGTLFQVALLAITSCARLRFSSERLDGLGRLTFGFLGAYMVAQFIVPFEVLVAAHASTGGGPHFNYAYRTLAVVQLLIVGGLTLGALPEWSNYVKASARLRFQRSVVETASVAALALCLAAAIALVASTSLVRLAFQHGTFSSHDTQAVSSIVLAALVGFVAEGLILVLSPALIADRRNRAAIVIGLCRTGCVVALVAIFGFSAGPVGVAIGYSAGNLILLLAQLAYMWRWKILTLRELKLIRSTIVVVGTTVLAAAAALLLPVPTLARSCLVLAVFAGLYLALDDTLPSIPRLPTPFAARRRRENNRDAEASPRTGGYERRDREPVTARSAPAE